MRKAAALDVTVYEDPVFYDRLERARVQATDRLAMIQQMGRLIQQTVTALAFSAVLIWYSPLLLFLLVAGVIPAFLGESHFAFLTYAKNFRQTPLRRQMDYLRQVGGSKEAAKELKLFNLSGLSYRSVRATSRRAFTRRMSRSIAAGCSGADCSRFSVNSVTTPLSVCSILSHHSRAATPSVISP